NEECHQAVHHQSLAGIARSHVTPREWQRNDGADPIKEVDGLHGVAAGQNDDAQQHLHQHQYLAITKAPPMLPPSSPPRAYSIRPQTPITKKKYIVVWASVACMSATMSIGEPLY